MTKVALIRGNNRYQNVFSALKCVEQEIKEKIKDKKKIVIKPNFVSARVQLAATHVDAVRAILDFLTPLTKQKITIAEGAALGETSEGWRNFDYLKLKQDYNIEFRDLNNDEYSEIEIFSRDLKPLKIGVAKTILESDFRISPAMLKTHDAVIATLSLKNMLVGSLDHKSRIHQGAKAINKSLAKLAEIIPPHLSIIDGFLGMENNGPVSGTPIEMKVALAGTDFLSVDTASLHLMGFDISQIGYLHHCKEQGLGQGELEKIEILGNVSLKEVKRKFEPHSSFQEQLNWQ